MKKTAVTLALCAFLVSFAFAQAPRDTYVYQTFGDPDSLDPAQSYDTASFGIIENIYETLYAYKGDKVDEYEPALATDYTVSGDGLTYTFTLRQGVKFHSGNDFTCNDVAYSLRRALVTNNADSGVVVIAEPLVGTAGNADTALGADATDADYADFFAKIEQAVSCTDDYTAVLKTVGPDPSFFSKLLFAAASIVDSKWAIENGQWDGTEATWRDWIGVDLHEYYLHDHMSGTGPYQLVEWVPGQRVVAKAFTGYWGGAPSLQNVLVQNVEDQNARILALKSGDADRIALGALSALTQIDGLPGVKVYNRDGELGWASTTVSAVFMQQHVQGTDNLGSGKLDGNGLPADFFTDVHMRRCANYSFDRDAYIQGALLGYGSTITMALPSSFLGYDPSVPEYTLDLEKAEEECKQAWDGQVWDKGFELNILYNTGNTSRQTVAEILKANLESLNPKFKVNVRGIAWPDFLAQQNANALPFFVLGWAPDYADPDTFMHIFYASTGFFASRVGFKDPQIDALDAQARTDPDPAARAFFYGQIGQLAFDQSPFILIPVARAMITARADLHGVYYNPMLSGYFLWQDVSKD